MTPGPHRKNGNNVFPAYICISEEIIMVAKSIATIYTNIHKPTDYMPGKHLKAPLET